MGKSSAELGRPSVNIAFKAKAQTMMKRGERGIVALLLEDEVEGKGIYEIKNITDIPKELSEENQGYIFEAYKGNDTIPSKIYAVTYSGDLDEGLKKLGTLDFQYGAIPGISEEDAEFVALWTKEEIDKKDRTIVMVLPDTSADHEGIINLTTTDILMKNGDTPTTSEFTARIAGFIAGTPLSKSTTFSVLDDVESVEFIDKDEEDKRIRAGEFILINENNKVKVARGVNSLVTISENKNKQWKKILIVEKMNMWKDDVKSTISDYYIGKFSNHYDNKILAITDIRLYNKALAKEGILDNSLPHYNDVQVDIEAQRDYLESIQKLEEGMTEEEIKKSNTGDKVFIGTNLVFTDAMEEFFITAQI